MGTFSIIVHSRPAAAPAAGSLSIQSVVVLLQPQQILRRLPWFKVAGR
jgi:hypothetical protein